ncbi:MAG TPA: glycosyltransferase family 4 protein [Spirochaetia bacterium]|nr:glycosyltransferase family 4 protein [Spirochaetia bacterium]
MRVGLVIYGDLDFPSGGFLYDRMLVDSLRRSGNEVEVISLPWDSYRKCLAHNVDPAIRVRLLGWKGDVLLQDELCHPSLFGVNRKLTGSFPVVSIVHHLRFSELHAGPARSLQSAVERSYLRGVKHFVFNGSVTRRTVEALAGRPCDGIIAPPGGDRLGPGISAAEIRERSDQEPLSVLFVGNLIPRKGLIVLLRALAMIPQERWRLTIVGSRAVDPSHAARVDRFISERGLAGKVRVMDHLDDSHLARELCSHHVLAVPSSYEGFGIVYLEAMGFGIVPIGSQSGGAAEVIQDGTAGFLVRPGDYQGLAKIIETLAEDRALLCAHATSALERYRAFPGWEQRMSEVGSYLRGVARSGGR